MPSNLENTLEEDVGDNDPTIADFVDERPEHVKILEQYRKGDMWKQIDKSEKDTDNSDASQPRQRNRHDSGSDASPPRRKRHDSDSDVSPPRRKRHDSDSDLSPPRTKNGKQSSIKNKSPVRKRHDSDSDQSPPRRKRHDSDLSPPRKRHNTQQLGNKYISPVRKSRHDSDSDQSLPRRKRHDSDSDQSPPRRQRKASDSDQSPPRRKNKNVTKKDSDQSPPRRKRNDSDSDQSPPRKKRNDSDSDQSPPRRKNINAHKTDDKGRARKTLGGATAGLSSAKEMKMEADKMKRREKEMFDKIGDDVLGKNSTTVFRDKSGKRRNIKEERLEQREMESKKADEEEKYMKWGKGLAQQDMQQKMVDETVHEMSKPLARYKDDEDLDAMLKEQDREGDPMLAYMKKKKAKENTGGRAKPEKPRYRGPQPPLNRYSIWPGYRWDGVDRSNGFEKEYFSKQSNKKAVEAMRYKWSVEDM